MHDNWYNINQVSKDFKTLRYLWMSSSLFQYYPSNYHTRIRLIPQGTVDNSLVPDRLAGPRL